MSNQIGTYETENDAAARIENYMANHCLDIWKRTGNEDWLHDANLHKQKAEQLKNYEDGR